MKNRSASQSLLIGVFIVMVLAASSSIVRADCLGPVTWTDGVGSWFLGTNWSGGSVPGPDTCVYINNTGTAGIHGGTDHAMAYSLVLGNKQGQSGSVTVDTDDTAVLDLGTTSCRGDIYVGNAGSGKLSIADAAYIRCGRAFVAAVANVSPPASSGSVTVEGDGTVWHIYQNFDTECPTQNGLFIGCTATSGGAGGVATVNVLNGGAITVYRDTSTDPAVTVGASGTLTGNGSLFLDDGVSSSKKLLVYGTLAPQSYQLTVEGNVQLTTGANTVFHVTSTDWDKLYVSHTGGGGSAILAGRITVTMHGSFTHGSSIPLLYTESGLTSMFDSVSIFSDSGYSGTITYDDYNVYLHVN